MPESLSNSAFAYRAFISYSHADRAWCDWLHKALETYRVPSRLVGKQTAAGVIPRRLNPIFRDRDELPSAHDLNGKVAAALAQSENLIVICSPASATSRWVSEEVLAYKRLGRAERIFCLIVEGEPNATDIPGRAAEECFCPALRFQLDGDGQLTHEPTEPIAADARAGKDRRPDARLKLIAGMLDVGFDALKQREQHRRVRRLTAIAALALVVMLVTSALAIDAVIARNAAISAQRNALIAQRAAERRQKQAEDLVDFMLGDLTTKLRQVDRLDVLSSVDDKAIAYFKSLPVSDVSATSLAQRAKALQNIGDVRTDQSRQSDALEAFQQALRLNKRLVDISPDDYARQNAYGENLLWIGFNNWNQGKLDGAENSFREAATALRRAAVLAPNNAKVQQNLALVYLDLGQVAQARDELASAQAYYIEYLDRSRRMAKSDPGNVQWRDFIADAYSDLGTVALARGNLGEALQDAHNNQRLMTELVAKAPNDRQLEGHLLTGDAIFGRTLALMGQTRAGLDYVSTAVNIAHGLIAFDPTHTDWQDSYAYYSRLLGHLLLEHGEVAAAEKPVNAAIATLGKLVAKDAARGDWRSDLAQAQLEGARVASARKQPELARTLALQGSANMQKLLAGDSPGTDAIRIQADIELLLGELAAAGGERDPAAQYRRKALARMRPLAAHSADPRDLAIWVDALSATGGKAQAQPDIEKLITMGYRPASFVARMHDQGIDYPDDQALDKRVARIIALSSVGPQAAQ